MIKKCFKRRLMIKRSIFQRNTTILSISSKKHVFGGLLSFMVNFCIIGQQDISVDQCLTVFGFGLSVSVAKTGFRLQKIFESVSVSVANFRFRFRVFGFGCKNFLNRFRLLTFGFKVLYFRS